MMPPGEINEAMIERLVHGFYAEVRQDGLLGPIFAAQVKDWESHLQRICAFWSSVLLKTGRYQGQPMLKHLPLPIDARHFDRWLELFAAATRQYCDPASAAQFVGFAGRIARSFEFGVAASQRVILQDGARLPPKSMA
ncbi:MAG TPA: group III truncated hemoglobin [Steroidobacteraceae bacterium]